MEKHTAIRWWLCCWFDSGGNWLSGWFDGRQWLCGRRWQSRCGRSIHSVFSQETVYIIFWIIIAIRLENQHQLIRFRRHFRWKSCSTVSRGEIIQNTLSNITLLKRLLDLTMESIFQYNESYTGNDIKLFVFWYIPIWSVYFLQCHMHLWIFYIENIFHWISR